MNKNTKIAVAAVFLLAAVLLGTLLYVNYFQGGKRVYNVNTGMSYSTIQTAIDAPETKDGHTLIVYPGVYKENVLVNKTLTVKGQDRDTTFVEMGDRSVIAVLIQADGATVANFTVRNSHFGIWTLRTKGVQIVDNKLVNCVTSIKVDFASETIVKRNRVVNGELQGILLYASFNNSVISNEVTNIKGETEAYGGIHLEGSWNNTVTLNEATNNTHAMWIDNAQTPNASHTSSYNRIHHNNFVNSSGTSSGGQAIDWGASNQWDNGYPSGGNYWSDYNGVDLYSGPSQNLTGSDGKGDSPYTINTETKDRYPLMEKVDINLSVP